MKLVQRVAGDHRKRSAERKTRPGLAREVWKKPALRSLLLALAMARLMRPVTERCSIDLECYPGLPYHRHMLWKVALYAGARLRQYPGETIGGARRPKLRVFWPDPSVVRELLPGRPVPPDGWRRSALNGRTGGASKRQVERAFAETFGYDLAVDPTVHVGPCVAKSDRLNGAHDGRVLVCPIAEADPALAYEVLIDNRVDKETVVDFRVPVLGGEIPFVYRKYRSVHARFSNANIAVEVADPAGIFSEGERAKLGRFCEALGLDLGVELDVLRDARDGRIYVVDANWTSWGPPRPLAKVDAVRAVRAYAAALCRLAERTTRGEEPRSRLFEHGSPSALANAVPRPALRPKWSSFSAAWLWITRRSAAS